MASDKNSRKQNRIPISFVDQEWPESTESEEASEVEDSRNEPGKRTQEQMESQNEETNSDETESINGDDEHAEPQPLAPEAKRVNGELGGPEVAELVATRAELKRVEAEISELKDRLARRQADFENYRKRIERERTETYSKVAADLAAKLLPVLDNLSRALDAEASVESSESDEFRHFLSGVDLIYRQLEGVIDAMGVKPVAAVGEPFNPHLHEAITTEATDEFEPDTVMQEIVRGYRMGDKLIRPAQVKVATKK